MDLGGAATTTEASDPLILPFSFSALPADDDDDDDKPDDDGSDAPASSSLLDASSVAALLCALRSECDLVRNFPMALRSAVFLFWTVNSSHVTFFTPNSLPAPSQLSPISGLFPLLLVPLSCSTFLIVQHPLLPISVCTALCFTTIHRISPHFPHFPFSQSSSTSPSSLLLFRVSRSPPSLQLLDTPPLSLFSSLPLPSPSTMGEAPGEMASRPMARPKDEDESRDGA